MQNTNSRNPNQDGDDRGYGRSDRQLDDQNNWRQSDQYAQGQSGYTAGRYQGDPSMNVQGRNQSYPQGFEDHSRGGDERFAGRGGSAGYNPERMGAQGGYGGGNGFEAERIGGQSTGYGSQGYGYGNGEQGFGAPGNGGQWGGQQGMGNYGAGSQQYGQSYGNQGRFQGAPQMNNQSQAGSRHRHNVGNYGYGSDSRSMNSGSMLDSNQGVGQQGHFGGSPGGYGHVGSYGAEGGAQNHGTQGWQGDYAGPGGAQQQGRMQGGHRGKGPKNFQRSDERIREAVSEALEIHDHIDATHVEVLVKQGEVTLSGSVDDRNAKRMAEDIAAAVSGVKDVQNQLRVGGDRQTSSQNPATKDAISTGRSEHAMPDTTDSRKARA